MRFTVVHANKSDLLFRLALMPKEIVVYNSCNTMNDTVLVTKMVEMILRFS